MGIWDVVRIANMVAILISLGCMVVAYRSWQVLSRPFKVLGLCFTAVLISNLYGVIEGLWLGIPGSPRLVVMLVVLAACCGAMLTIVRDDARP